MVEKKEVKSAVPINKGAVVLEPGSTQKYKTGDWRTYIPAIDQSKCIRCGKCWMTCPDAAVSKDESGAFRVNYNYCKGCLLCEKECPVKAISYKIEEK